MSEKILLASAARTATTDSGAQHNPDAEGVHVVIRVTAAADTPSVVPSVQGKDPASGVWYDVLVGLAVTGTGTTVIKIGPGIEPVANGAAADYLPDTWRVLMTHADTDSITYSVAAVLAE